MTGKFGFLMITEFRNCGLTIHVETAALDSTCATVVIPVAFPEFRHRT